MAIPFGNVNDTSPAGSAPQTATSLNICAAPAGFSSGIEVVVEDLGGSEGGSGGDTAWVVQAVTSVDMVRMSTATFRGRVTGRFSDRRGSEDKSYLGSKEIISTLAFRRVCIAAASCLSWRTRLGSGRGLLAHQPSGKRISQFSLASAAASPVRSSEWLGRLFKPLIGFMG